MVVKVVEVVEVRSWEIGIRKRVQNRVVWSHVIYLRSARGGAYLDR